MGSTSEMTITSRTHSKTCGPHLGDDDGDKPRRGGGDTDVSVKTKPRTKRPSLYKVLMLNDDYTPMEFVVDGLGEIAWWILGYGDQVEVIKPVALRKRIAKVAAKVVKLNS